MLNFPRSTMRLSDKAFKEKLSKRRPIRKTNVAVIGETTYSLMSNGSLKRHVLRGKALNKRAKRIIQRSRASWKGRAA